MGDGGNNTIIYWIHSSPLEFFYYKYCNFFIGIYKQSTLYCLCYVQQAKKMYKPLALWKKACYSDLEIDSHSFIYYIHTPGLWIKDNFPPERNIATRLLGRWLTWRHCRRKKFFIGIIYTLNIIQVLARYCIFSPLKNPFLPYTHRCCELFLQNSFWCPETSYHISSLL